MQAGDNKSEAGFCMVIRWAEDHIPAGNPGLNNS